MEGKQAPTWRKEKQREKNKEKKLYKKKRRMAPPPSTVVSPAVALIVRVLTFVSVLISIIILATANTTVVDMSLGVAVAGKLKFSNFYAYRYMLASAVIGLVYTLLQTAFTIYFVSSGNRIGGESLALLDFYGDKALSYLLATGAAAGFGLTVDTKRPQTDSDVNSFFNKANAAASLLLIGFIFSAISSIFSSLSLPKRS